MQTPRAASVAIKVAVVAFLAATVWVRISSLDAVPDHNGDESYEGTQISRMIRGEPFTLLTTNNNLMDPFFVALQAPFQMAFRPSLWVLRAPAVVSGLLTMLLAYRLGSRILGRQTALIATVCLGALPAAVVYSRYGFEYCQIPLAGVVAIYFAFRANAFGLALALVAGLLVHPLDVFLIPVVAPIFLTRWMGRLARDPVRRRRALIAASVATIVAVGGLAGLMLRRPVVREALGRRPPLDWLTFFEGLEKFLMYRYVPIADSTLALQRWLCWGVVIVVLDQGVRNLVKRRHWDRLALLVGTAASLAAFHVLAGPRQMIDAATHRYGVVFLAPVVLSFACLAHAVLAPLRSRIPRAAFLLAIGCGLFLCLKVNWIDFYTRSGRESAWTARADVRDPHKQALSIILTDADRSAGGRARPLSILAQEYWDARPLEYLASRDARVRVEQLIGLEDIYLTMNKIEDRFAIRQAQVVDQLRSGGYVVALCNRVPEHGGAVVEAAVRSAFPPEAIRRWMIADRNYVPAVTVYRLAHPGDRPNWTPRRTAGAGPPASVRR